MLLGSGRELASRFQKLGSHLLDELRPAEHNRFGEALSVRYRTQRPRRAAAGDTCQEDEAVDDIHNTLLGRPRLNAGRPGAIKTEPMER